MKLSQKTKLLIVISLLAAGVIFSNLTGPRIRTFDMIGKNYRFSPETLRVDVGDTVRINFSNPDVVPHLIDLPAFNTHIALIPGGSFPLEFIADKAGTFPYVCSVPGHEEAGMTGVLIVDPVD